MNHQKSISPLQSRPNCRRFLATPSLRPYALFSQTTRVQILLCTRQFISPVEYLRVATICCLLEGTPTIWTATEMSVGRLECRGILWFGCEPNDCDGRRFVNAEVFFGVGSHAPGCHIKRRSFLYRKYPYFWIQCLSSQCYQNHPVPQQSFMVKGSTIIFLEGRFKPHGPTRFSDSEARLVVQKRRQAAQAHPSVGGERIEGDIIRVVRAGCCIFNMKVFLEGWRQILSTKPIPYPLK